MVLKDNATHVKILTLDIDSSSLRQLKPVVVEMGLEILTARNETDALDQIEKQHPDVLLLDLETQEARNYPIIDRMGGVGREIPVIFLAQTPEEAPALDGRPTATLTRPIVADDFKKVIGRVTGGAEALVVPPQGATGSVSELGDYGTQG